MIKTNLFFRCYWFSGSVICPWWASPSAPISATTAAVACPPRATSEAFPRWTGTRRKWGTDEERGGGGEEGRENRWIVLFLFFFRFCDFWFLIFLWALCFFFFFVGFSSFSFQRYCCTTCRDVAFTQYYAFMASSDGEGMSEKYHTLRMQVGVEFLDERCFLFFQNLVEHQCIVWHWTFFDTAFFSQILSRSTRFFFFAVQQRRRRQQRGGQCAVDSILSCLGGVAHLCHYGAMQETRRVGTVGQHFWHADVSLFAAPGWFGRRIVEQIRVRVWYLLGVLGGTRELPNPTIERRVWSTWITLKHLEHLEHLEHFLMMMFDFNHGTFFWWWCFELHCEHDQCSLVIVSQWSGTGCPSTNNTARTNKCVIWCRPICKRTPTSTGWTGTWNRSLWYMLVVLVV
jgi:hypothetical protein